MKYSKIVILIIVFAAGLKILSAAVATGDLKVWHKITVTADGPAGGENEATFKDHRMTVTFTHSDGHAYTLSGYFAADGNAANTSATSGNKWRCHFRPDAAGTWTYTISFLKGTNIALKVNSDNSGGSPVAPNGETGTFDVAGSDKTGWDFRNPERGLLKYVDKHYLKFSGSNRWFIRSGPGIPEKFLNKVFDPFFTTKGQGEGTGLGLNIVHRMVEKYRGRIEVDSQVGEGTTFRVIFPIDAKTPENSV